jgi:hypothetical protein
MNRISTLTATLATLAALIWMLAVGAKPTSLYAATSFSPPAAPAQATPAPVGAHG